MNQLYAAVRRHLIAEGWDPATVRSPDGSLGLSLDHWLIKQATRLHVIDHRITGGYATVLDIKLTTLQDAIDHLVVAGILPATFASWGGGYVPFTDGDGDAVGYRDSEYVRYPGQQCHFVRPGTQAPTDWEPLYRRVAQSLPAVAAPVCPRCKCLLGDHTDSGCTACSCPLVAKHATWLAGKIAAKTATAPVEHPELHDRDSDLWTWHPAGYLRYDDGGPLTREELNAEFGPTHEVVN